jgi:predicted O-methyltransferase YrrM
MMSNFPLKVVRYINCYLELAGGGKPETVEEVADYCVDRPILMAQVRSEIVALGKILERHAPAHSLEIGTNYGGTLLLLCSLSPARAQIISVDLPAGRFGGGYPKRKIPLFRKFPKPGQQLHLIRGDSHREETRQRVLQVLDGKLLDYLFLDGDHTYDGVRQDFEMYAPLVRSGGIICLHDIAFHPGDRTCQVDKFWGEIKNYYRYKEIIEHPEQGWGGLGILFLS